MQAAGRLRNVHNHPQQLVLLITLLLLNKSPTIAVCPLEREGEGEIQIKIKIAKLHGFCASLKTCGEGINTGCGGHRPTPSPSQSSKQENVRFAHETAGDQAVVVSRARRELHHKPRECGVERIAPAPSQRVAGAVTLFDPVPHVVLALV